MVGIGKQREREGTSLQRLACNDGQTQFLSQPGACQVTYTQVALYSRDHGSQDKLFPVVHGIAWRGTIAAVLSSCSTLPPSQPYVLPQSSPVLPAGENLTVVAVRKGGEQKVVKFSAGEHCTVLWLFFNKIGAQPFCSHDYGGEIILRNGDGVTNCIPFDLRRVMLKKAEDPKLMDGDWVVFPNLRGWSR